MMKNKGMTLIEVLVSSLILVLAIGSMLMIYVQQASISRSNNKLNAALMIIQDSFERVKSSQDPTSLKPSLEIYDKNNPKTIQVGDNSFDLSYEVEVVDYDGNIGGTTDPRLYQVKATVEWIDGKGVKNISMSTRTNSF